MAGYLPHELVEPLAGLLVVAAFVRFFVVGEILLEFLVVVLNFGYDVGLGGWCVSLTGGHGCAPDGEGVVCSGFGDREVFN